MLVPICIIIMLMQINKLLCKCGYEDICETIECLVVTLPYLSLSFGKSQSGKVEMACGSVIVRFGLYFLVFYFYYFIGSFML